MKHALTRRTVLTGGVSAVALTSAVAQARITPIRLDGISWEPTYLDGAEPVVRMYYEEWLPAKQALDACYERASAAMAANVAPFEMDTHHPTWWEAMERRNDPEISEAMRKWQDRNFEIERHFDPEQQALFKREHEAVDRMYDERALSDYAMLLKLAVAIGDGHDIWTERLADAALSVTSDLEERSGITIGESE